MNAEDRDEPLQRVIGPLGYSAITLNGVIGAGIFGLPAVAAARAGTFSAWIFVLCALLILTIVLAFARAATFVRHTGGPIAYATHAFGPFVGFQTGWIYYVSRVAAMGANTNLLVTYAAWFWPPLDEGLPRQVAITAILSLLTAVNYIGVRYSMIAIYVLTVMKLLPLLLLVLLGLGSLQASLVVSPDLPPVGSLGETILVVLYAFVGFEATVVQAGEGRQPRRDIPLALVRTVLLITVIYFMIQWVVQSVLPDLARTDRPLIDAAQFLMGGLGALVLSIGAVSSIFGNASASMMSAPRMVYALARARSLPAVLGAVHPRFATPHVAIAFHGLLSLVLALSGSFVWLAVISTVARLLMYMVSIASLPALEKRMERHADEFQLPGGWLLPVVALFLCTWLLLHASLSAWLMLGGLGALGALLYAWSRRATGPTPEFPE